MTFQDSFSIPSLSPQPSQADIQRWRSQARRTIPSTTSAASSASARENRAVDKNSNPVVVYRGEHGEPGEVPFQTRQGSITFVDDPRAASRYATVPNDRHDVPRAPRVFQVTLDIRKPVINQPGDPFIDGAQISMAVGEEEAREILIRHAGAIEHTDNWHRLGADFAGTCHFLKERPKCFGELYLDAYHILDDAKAVEVFRERGYDGAIYRGSGLTRNNVEYRVFSPCQVQTISPKALASIEDNSVIASHKPEQAITVSLRVWRLRVMREDG
jgi:hypothetical protein